jgi:integrase
MADGGENFLTLRGGKWHFVRRVPKAFRDLDKRGIVRLSTGIKLANDRTGIRARQVALQRNAELEAFWRGMADGKSADAQRRYDEARRRARQMGFDYMPAPAVAELPLDELVTRVEALIKTRSIDAPEKVAAVLGGEQQTSIMLSRVFDVFETLVRAELKGMSANQLRKWRNAKQRALEKLIAVTGDKPLPRLTRNDALDFQQSLQDLILSDSIKIGTANKTLGHINRMIGEIDRRHRLGLGPIFRDLQIGGGIDGVRKAFPIEFVQNVLLKAGTLDGLNDEARALVYLLAETGLRPSEACNLTKSTIVLDHKIPHVKIVPEGRVLKTHQSLREHPLVGVALKVAKAFPSGFPRYRDKSDSLSATVNKFLEENNLRTPLNCTLYGLRHTFKDRLRAARASDELMDVLMGHRSDKPEYGGWSLEQKRDVLHQIAFKPPSRI